MLLITQEGERSRIFLSGHTIDIISYVIHLSSGTAGFVGAYWIGPRIEEDLDDATPNNILLMLVGAGILWIGWNGFNGGDPYSASPDAGAAVLNTNLCTAFSSLVWVLMDLVYFRRPSVIGAIQGMITGLVSSFRIYDAPHLLIERRSLLHQPLV